MILSEFFFCSSSYLYWPHLYWDYSLLFFMYNKLCRFTLHVLIIFWCVFWQWYSACYWRCWRQCLGWGKYAWTGVLFFAVKYWSKLHYPNVVLIYFYPFNSNSYAGKAVHAELNENMDGSVSSNQRKNRKCNYSWIIFD